MTAAETRWTPTLVGPEGREGVVGVGPEPMGCAARLVQQRSTGDWVAFVGGGQGHLSHRRAGCGLLVWLVGVTGLEPVTSSL
jgi:hypothetical protein